MELYRYKRCVVPKCINTSSNEQNKVFFEVPPRKNKDLRDKWRDAIGGFQKPVSMETDNMLCCEDHFDVPKDTLNYSKYLMSRDVEGSSKIRLLLKSDAVPHRFECQKRATKAMDMVSMECSSNISEISSKYININNLDGNKTVLQDNAIVDSINDNNNPSLNDNNSEHKHKEIEIRNKRLIASCKPVKIKLHDLNCLNKNIVSLYNKLKSHDYVTKEEPIVKLMGARSKRKQGNDDNRTLEKRRKLIHKILQWEREQTQCIEIYNKQTKEIDIYYINSNLEVTTYKRISTLDNETYKEFKGQKDNVIVGHCCCWFRREYFIRKLPAKIQRSCIKFMQKSHECKDYNCSCCCRNIPQISREITDKLTMSTEVPSVWLKKLKADIKLFKQSNHILRSAIMKSLIDLPKPRLNVLSDSEKQYETMKIRLNNEYYQIEPNGHIALYFKNRETSKFSKTSLNIDIEICCWYKREQIAQNLLVHKIRNSTVNFIRNPHLCLTKCNCCCKPKKVDPGYKSFVYSSLPTKHTTDMRSKSYEIGIKLPNMTHPDTFVNWSAFHVRISQKNVSENALKSSVISLSPNMKKNKKSYIVPSQPKAISKSSIATITLSDDEDNLTDPMSNSTVSTTHITSITDTSGTMSRATFLNTKLTHSAALKTNVPASVSQNSTVGKTVLDNKLLSTATSAVNQNVIKASYYDSTGASTSRDSSMTLDLYNQKQLPHISANNLAPARTSNILYKERVPRIEIISKNVKRKSPQRYISVKEIQNSLVASNSKNSINKSTMSFSDSTDRYQYKMNTGSSLKHVKETPKVPTKKISITENVPTSFYSNTTSTGTLTANKVDKMFPIHQQVAPKVSNSKFTQIERNMKISNKPDVDICDNQYITQTSPSIPEISSSSDNISVSPILTQLKNLRVINKPGEKLSIQLDTPLKSLSTSELQILNSIFFIVENQLKASGLTKTNFQIDLLDSLIKNEENKFESVPESIPHSSTTVKMEDEDIEVIEHNAHSPISIKSEVTGEDEENKIETENESTEINTHSEIKFDEVKKVNVIDPEREINELKRHLLMSIRTKEKEQKRNHHYH